MTTFVEKNENVAIRLKDLKEISRNKNSLQESVVYHHSDLGYVLVIDGELQHVEAWYFCYHEPLVHFPCSFIRNPKHVLILGGGDFFAAREILKYKSVTEVTMYDHDPDVIERMLEIYPHARAAKSDPRMRIFTEDATLALSAPSEHYDLIINDCFDLVNDFKNVEVNIYNDIYKLLTKDGICSDLIYRSILEGATTQNAFENLSKYENKAASLLYVPEYPGIMHILTAWGKNSLLRQKPKVVANIEQKTWGRNSGITLYYSPENFSFHQYIPPFLKSAFSDLDDKAFPKTEPL